MTKSLLKILIITTALFVFGISCSEQDHKMPVTTISSDARELYLEGRDLLDALKTQEAAIKFKEAIQEDPDFAMAYIGLAITGDDPSSFFELIDSAKMRIYDVSPAEKLLIQEAVATSIGDQASREDILTDLVALYPLDERTHSRLGNLFFSQSRYDEAIKAYKHALALNKDFPPPYNQLGYSYRRLEQFDKAAESFKQYIELSPEDPNPYDSYAELEMRLGNFKESIVLYKKALKLSRDFYASHIGIATDLMYLGKHDEAREELTQLYKKTRSYNWRRTSNRAKAMTYLDQDMLSEAVASLEKSLEIAKNADDRGAIAADFSTIGVLYLVHDYNDSAVTKFKSSIEAVRTSDLVDKIKENAERNYLLTQSMTALFRDDLKEADKYRNLYSDEVLNSRNPFEIRALHLINGSIAIKENNFKLAIEELEQTDKNDPYALFQLATAIELSGDIDQSNNLYSKIANLNLVGSIRYVLVRNKAIAKVGVI